MQLRQSLLCLFVLGSLLFALTGEALQPNPRINVAQSKDPKLNQVQDELSSKVKFVDDEESANINLNDDQERIKISEPIKSLIQTSARFALVQMKISNHVNIETVMDLINKVGYALL